MEVPAKQQLLKENEELLQTKRAMLNLLEDLNAEKIRIAEEKAKMDALIASIDDGIIGTDAKGVINFVNKSFLRITGYAEKELLGKEIHDFPMRGPKGELLDDAQRPAYQVLKSGIPVTMPLAFIGKRMTSVSVTVSPVVHAGKLEGLVVRFHDITKQREADEMKDNFLALVTHQLRSPLGTIRWYTEMLNDGDLGEMNKDQKDFADKVQKGVTRLAETVDALLALSKLDGQLIVDSQKKCDICEIVNDALEVERLGITEKKLHVSMRCPIQPIKLNVNASLLRQVFGNLISNAVRYSKPNGKIIITLQDEADGTRFTIKDTGIGVPLHEQKNLFTKFYRASNAIKYVPYGSGLGLMLVKKITEAIHGKVEFVSKLDKGTTVTVHIPKNVK